MTNATPPSLSRKKKVGRGSLNQSSNRGFALVATISVMALLVLVSLSMLTLSTITARTAIDNKAEAEAKANARLALMIAIGELQKEMGPDMRISAESAILDSDEDTASINGVSQSRWLASYNSWGSWLNASYTLPDGSQSMRIQDTYTKGRDRMFRRWLVSLPEDKIHTLLLGDGNIREFLHALLGKDGETA